METKCSTCGNSSLTFINGSQFCEHCGTEHHDILELQEQNPVNHSDALKGTNYVWGKRTKVIKSNLNKKESIVNADNETDGWTTYEAFNVILSQWCDVLMKMGVSPKLKETVFKLWVMYLDQSKVAFIDDYSSFENLMDFDEIEGLAYGRDLKCLKAFDSEITKSHKKKYCKNRLTISAKKKIDRKKIKHTKSSTMNTFLVHLLNKSLASSDILNETEKMENCNDNSLSEIDIDKTLNSSSFISNYESHENKDVKNGYIKKKRYLKKRLESTSHQNLVNQRKISPLHFDSIKLLALFYIGVLLCKEDILLTDILWWCKSNIIPYFSAACLLDERYKFLPTDTEIFNFTTPFSNEVILAMSRMSTFLQIQTIPFPPILQCAQQLLDTLNLPHNLLDMIIPIVEQFSTGNSGKSIPNFEIDVANATILTLKILYGLDGVHEYMHSKFADNVNKVLNKDSDNYILFSWTCWCKNTNKLKYLEQTLSPLNMVLPAIDDSKILFDAKTYSQYFWSTGIWNRPQLEAEIEENTLRWDVKLHKQVLNNSTNELEEDHLFFEKCKTDAFLHNKMYKQKNWMIDCQKSQKQNISNKNRNLVSFTNDNIINFNNISEIKEKCQKLGYVLSVNEVPVSFSCEKELGELKLTKKKISVDISNPTENFWPIKDLISTETEFEKIRYDLPNSFCFLLELMSSLCHMREYDILNDYVKLECSYLKQCQSKSLLTKKLESKILVNK